MVTRIISIGRGSRLDKGFIGQDEGSAGAGAATSRLTTTRKRPSEELSTTQGEQLMIRATAMIFVPQGATLGIPVESEKHGGKVTRCGEPQHCPYSVFLCTVDLLLRPFRVRSRYSVFSS